MPLPSSWYEPEQDLEYWWDIGSCFDGNGLIGFHLVLEDRSDTRVIRSWNIALITASLYDRCNLWVSFGRVVRWVNLFLLTNL
jgi:hypothetical protein